MTQPPWGKRVEQKRIVARMDELLRWCDTLEARWHQTRTLGVHRLEVMRDQIPPSKAGRRRL